MQLTVLVAILMAVVISENAPQRAEDPVALRLGLAVLGVLLVAGFAWAGGLAVRRGCRGAESPSRTEVRRFCRLQQAHALLWLAVSCGSLQILHWPTLVLYDLGLQGLVLLDQTLVFAPLWLSLCCSWAAFYDVECSLGLWPPEGRLGTAWRQRFSYVWFQLRHSLGLFLLPVLLVAAVHDLLTWLPGAWHEAVPQAVWMACPLVAISLAFPLLLRVLLGGRPLPAGPLRTRLTDAFCEARVRIREIFVWRTEGRLMNAAVAGFVAPLRYVFVTDGLLQGLSPPQVEAVMMHEAAHLKRGHLRIRLLTLALPVWWAVFWATPLVATADSAASGGPLNNPLAAILMPLCIALYVLVVLPPLCRWLEFDADLYAGCAADGNRAAALSAALRSLSVERGQRRRGGWLHPSVARRTALLRLATRDATVRDRFDRRLQWLRWGLLAAWLAAPLGMLLAG